MADHNALEKCKRMQSNGFSQCGKNIPKSRDLANKFIQSCFIQVEIEIYRESTDKMLLPQPN